MKIHVIRLVMNSIWDRKPEAKTNVQVTTASDIFHVKDTHIHTSLSDLRWAGKSSKFLNKVKSFFVREKTNMRNECRILKT